MDTVTLYIYDLSRGVAKQFAPLLAPGLKIDGIWHTSIVVFNSEWFFGTGGIESLSPGSSTLGAPLESQLIGHTSVNSLTFKDHLKKLSASRYASSTYNLFTHNCNHFSDEISRFLVSNGTKVPSYILDLPSQVLNSPLAELLGPMIQNATPRGQNMSNQKEIETISQKEDQDQISQKEIDNFFLVSSSEMKSYSSAIEINKFSLRLSDLSQKNSGKNVSCNLSQFTEFLTTCHSWSSLWPSIHSLLTFWPKEDIYPLLDVIRFSTGTPEVRDIEESLFQIHSDILSLFLHKNPENEANIKLTLKIYTNFFLYTTGNKVFMSHDDVIFSHINDWLKTQKLNDVDHVIQNSLAKLLYNYSKALTELHTEYYYSGALEEKSFFLLSSLHSIYLPMMKHGDAILLSLFVLGSNLLRSSETREYGMTLDFSSLLSSIGSRHSKGPHSTNVQTAVKMCRQILKK